MIYWSFIKFFSLSTSCQSSLTRTRVGLSARLSSSASVSGVTPWGRGTMCASCWELVVVTCAQQQPSHPGPHDLTTTPNTPTGCKPRVSRFSLAGCSQQGS